MKILYFVTQGEQGGAQKYVFDLATKMKERGNEVFVVTGLQSQEKDKWLFENLEKNNFPKENLFEIKNHVREIKIIKQIKGLIDFTKLVLKIKPDVIHANSSMAGFVGSLAGFVTQTKVVFTVHGFYFLEPMNFLKKIFFICLELFSSFLRNFTILVSQKDVEVGKSFFILRSNKKYKLIYNGILEENKKLILDKAEAKKFIEQKIGRNLDTNMKVVGTISNLYKTKGLEFFIDAAKKVLENREDVTFVLFGFGSEKYLNELQEKVKENNLENNFFFLGKVPDAFKYLKSLNVFTLTSLKEGLPYCLLEAKLASVPIVASNVGSVSEMAKNFEISLVEAKNVDEISKKILDNLEKPKEFFSDFPKIYSLESMLNETEKVYNHIK